MEDFKDRNGKWVCTFKMGGKQTYTCSGTMWTAMKNRCLQGGAAQVKQPAYLQCVNGFYDFHEFTDWHLNQVGYGKGWHLEKDILGDGKVYSPTTCVLAPQEINNLILTSASIRGEWPIGVSFDREYDKFSSSCKVYGKCKKIGRYSTPEAAFEAYKIFKESHIKAVAAKWQDQIDHRLYGALMSYEITREC